jgi:hypothetical protein
MNARPLPRPSSTSRGYTAVEVLMAMTVMVIGGAAVITMQKTSITANLDARKTDVANQIARTWVERLQRDAMVWTLPGPDGNGNNINNALIIGTVATNTAGTWFLPDQELGQTSPESMSPGFDILGRDVLPANADFCVNVRLSFLPQPPAPQDLVRADVRVIWPIGVLSSATGFCNPALSVLPDPNTYRGAGVVVDPNADPSTPIFHTIYLSTSIRENATQ